MVRNVRDIEKAIERAFKYAQDRLPRKTGNMAYNATKMNGHTEITIEIKDAIAPYAKYLNNPKWRSYKFWERFKDDMFGVIEIETLSKIRRI